MMVELADAVSSQDRGIEWSTYQRTVFPEPATKRETISVGERATVGQQLAFPMHP